MTFVDNHDTEYRREKEHQANYDSTRHFPGTTVDMAYAYMLTHPGMPCVFWSHYFDWGRGRGETIDRLIARAPRARAARGEPAWRSARRTAGCTRR